ncbi:MAG: SEL1-like repeat protein [Selenomonadaceae bacterium]|nr:SEL1-like repeat protein [Selenomonadaceae bacterium]
MALVKFPLIMADGFKANTLEELKEHFDIKSVLGYFRDRRLIRWLKARNYVEEVAAVEKLSKDENNLSRKLGAIFGFEIEGDDEPDITEIMRRLRQLTADKELLAQVEQELTDGSALVVFNQSEFDAEAQDFDRIYLASSQFVIPLTETDKTYIGIGENVRAVIKSDKIVDFDALNITFERIRFDDDYQKTVAKLTEEATSNRAEELFEEAQDAAYGENDWTTALEKFKQSAELGYTKAFGAVGYIYYFGEGGIEQDINAARHWLKLGVEKNDSNSFGRYALLLSRDDASEDDKREAFKCMKRATEFAPEDSGWWFLLGEMYDDGRGTKKNLAKTVECYEKGVQFGNSWAANRLGVMYSNGEYVEQNPRKAFELYKKAVELDNINANTAAVINLAGCYRYGEGTEKNSALAFKYYKQAADAGDVNAIIAMGEMFRNGEGSVDKNFKEALRYFQRAANEGNANAMNSVALIYDQGGYGVEQDFQEAFQWFKKSAEAGDPNGMSNLSLCYLWGTGIRKNINLAEYWMKKAAEAGAYYGMLQYANDWFASKDRNNYKLAEMYEQVANAGYGEAAYKLAMMYLNGWGVQQSTEIYEYWLSKSQELGYEPD